MAVRITHAANVLFVALPQTMAPAYQGIRGTSKAGSASATADAPRAKSMARNETPRMAMPAAAGICVGAAFAGLMASRISGEIIVAQPIIGTTGDDTLTGDDNTNRFLAFQGGDDTITALGGNDVIVMGRHFTTNDHIDGGNGADIVSLNGDYAEQVTFGAATMVNVEQIQLGGGFSYDLKTDNATVAAGAHLTIKAYALQASDQLIFDGSAETDGHFRIDAGAGDDVLTGGQAGDIYFLTRGGEDTVHGHGGRDVIVMGDTLDAGDSIDGGNGTNDLMRLNGMGVADSIVFGPTTVTNVEILQLGNGHSYALVTDDATVAAGATLFVRAADLGVNESKDTLGGSGDDFLNFDGSVESDGRFVICGGHFDDVLTGGAGNDIFNIKMGGNDTVQGGGGNDAINAGAVFTQGDIIDGGAGHNLLTLDGSYPGGDVILLLSNDSLSHIQTVKFLGGFDYGNVRVSGDITTATGTLTLDASNAHSLFLDLGLATSSDYVIIGGTGDDNLGGGSGSNLFILSQGGSDTATGGASDDIFVMGAALDANDLIDGGGGHNTLTLNGDYSGGFDFDGNNATNIVNIQTIAVAAGHSYNLTLEDSLTPVDTTLTVTGAALGASDVLTVNGSAESDADLVLIGGAGNDVLAGGENDEDTDTFIGGGGADDLTSNDSGNDTFIYKAVSDSTSVNYDTIHNFDARGLSIVIVPGRTLHTSDLSFVVSGALSTASFDTDLAAAVDGGHLAVGKYVIFEPDSGTLAGHAFLVVDDNGVAGYQAGADIVIDITGFIGGDDGPPV